MWPKLSLVGMVMGTGGGRCDDGFYSLLQSKECCESMLFDVCFNFSGSNLVFYSISFFACFGSDGRDHKVHRCSMRVVLFFSLNVSLLNATIAHKTNEENKKTKRTHSYNKYGKNYGIRWKCSFYRYVAFWHWLNHTVTRTRCTVAPSILTMDNSFQVQRCSLFHLTFMLKITCN